MKNNLNHSWGKKSRLVGLKQVEIWWAENKMNAHGSIEFNAKLIIIANPTQEM